MKRFLISAVVLLVLIVGGLYLFFNHGFYLNINPDAPISADFRTDGKTITVLGKDGSFAPFEIKGVALTASAPGQYDSTFAPDEEDYLRWLENIAAMGANTVRVYTIMDDQFYRAFYDFNEVSTSPLYLLQGVQLESAAVNSYHTAFSSEFLDELKHTGNMAVDIIHGRRIAMSGQMLGGSYLHDISEWTLGYVIGHEWNADTVVYTDNAALRSGSYDGSFFSTAENATPFEAMLTQVMDSMLTYESNKYREQRLISFSVSPDIDFLTYDEKYARQLRKYACVDAEHIVQGDMVKSGIFSLYRLYDFCDDFSLYLSAEQKAALTPELSGIDSSRSFGGYLDLISAYHTMPVVIDCGFSSSRGAVAIGQNPLTEYEQGQSAVRVWKDANLAGLSGMCISTWQDSWQRRTWNTAFATATARNYLWHDLQTDGQSYGLMSFDPCTKAICTVDGIADEWQGDSPVLTGNGLSLSLRCDHQGLFLLVQGDSVSPENRLFLPFDMTDDLGSFTCADPTLSFDRAADFVLCIDGTENSRLLVQERYDAARANFGYELGSGNPYFDIPEADSPIFKIVNMVLRNDTLVDTDAGLPPEDVWQMRALGLYDTGKLTHGCGDPSNENYNSLADFCFGENCVEIRLPWLLLNVADPTLMQVHGDYYTNYGVVSEITTTFYIGLGSGSDEISLTPVKTSGWDLELEWRERLKQSYYVIQQYWQQ